MSGKTVTVFGASGFVGHFLIKSLCKDGWRVRAACRQPQLASDLKLAGDIGQVQLVQANVRNRESVRKALEGSSAAVNLVSILYESGAQTYKDTQLLGSTNIAQAAAELGITRLIQVSAIGADADSKSKYASSKAESENAVRAAIPTATIIRPSIIFGPEDGFFTRFAEMARLTPILPLIGGSTKFQPVHVGDVADAIAAALSRDDALGETYELGGPRTYTMKQLLQYITREIDRPRILLPIPMFIASALGYTVGLLSRLNPFFGPPITGDQVQLLKEDNIVAPGARSFADLGITNLETVEAIAPTYLWRHRPYGQFHIPKIDDTSRADA